MTSVADGDAAGGAFARRRGTGAAAHGRAAATRDARPVRPVDALRVATWLMLAGNLLRLPLFSAGTKDAPLLLNDLAVAATVLLGALASLQARRVRADAVAGAACAFAAVGLASAILAGPRFGLTGTQIAFSLAYLARWLLYFGVYLVMLNGVRRDDVRGLAGTFERAVLAFAAFGVLQALLLPGFAQLVYPEDASGVRWDRQGHRLVSTLLDPNFAGALILVPLLVLLARVSYGERERPWKLILLVGALLLTVSRSSVLALAVGGLTIVAARGVNRRVLRTAGWGLVLLLPVLPALIRLAAGFNKFRLDGSALARAVSWLRALHVLSDNLLVGVGFNTYGFVQEFYGYERAGRDSFALDGGLLFVAVMTGLVGLALYLAMLAAAVRRCRRVWRDGERDGWERGTALGVAAATVALVVHSVFVNSLLLPILMQAMWMLWGAVVVLARPRPRPEPADAPRLVAL